MDPATAAAAANAVANIGGSLFGKKGNSSKKAMNMWKEQFNLQKAWEKEKMQSSHQWEVQDLLNAGLNPVLSANGGATNASAPSPNMPDLSTYENAKTQKLATAINLMNAYTQAKAQKSQAELNEATKTKTEAEAGMIEPKAMAEIKHLNSAAAVNKAQENLIDTTTTTTEEGILAKILGTKNIKEKRKLAAAGASMALGATAVGKAISTAKKLKNTIGFAKFLKSIK